jgi:hypothetical protein
MWRSNVPFSLDKARDFLRQDFLKALVRTRYLYVEAPPPIYGPGFFEPVVLCFCWIDFLGALYLGTGTSQKNERGVAFLDCVVAKINPAYAAVSAELLAVYRNGMVHAYAPAGQFDLRTADRVAHLSRTADHQIVISIEDLVEDLIESTCRYADELSDNDPLEKPGNLAAFNKAHKELGGLVK